MLLPSLSPMGSALTGRQLAWTPSSIAANTGAGSLLSVQLAVPGGFTNVPLSAKTPGWRAPACPSRILKGRLLGKRLCFSSHAHPRLAGEARAASALRSGFTADGPPATSG